jgi:hypothetical protein
MANIISNGVKGKLLIAIVIMAAILGTSAYADLYLNSQTGFIYFNTSNTARLEIRPGGDAYFLDQANVSLPANLTVDTGTLFVDSVSNRVGVGTKNPQFEFEVIGTGNFSSDLYVTGVIYGNLGAGNITGSLTDSQIDNDITIQTTSDLTVGGGYGSGGITLVASGNDKGTGQFGKDILLDGDIVSVYDVEINQSFIPVKDSFALLGNFTNRFLDAYVLNFKGGNQSITIDANATITGNLSFVDVENYIYQPAANTLAIGTNAAERVRVDSSGNLGIGTSTPDSKITAFGSDSDANLVSLGLLHLNITDKNNFSTSNFITLDHNLDNPENSTGGIGLGVLFRATNNDSELVNVSFINASLVNAINGSEASSLSFYTRNGQSGLVPKVVLNGSDVFLAPTGGVVAVGKTNGSEKLEVGGNIRLDGNVSGASFNVNETSTSVVLSATGSKNLIFTTDPSAWT